MATINTVFNMHDRISSRIDQVANRTEKLRKNLKTMAKVGAAAFTAVAVAAGAFATSSFNDFIGFDKQMRETFTLLPGISQQAMEDMSSDVKKFAKDFKVLPENVVPALYQSLSAGVPKDNVFDFLAVAQKAAVGGVAELETAVDGISSIINAYGTDVIDATKASDLMFTAVKLGKTSFGELSNSLYNVIPTASALGVEFGDVTAGLAAITAQGTPTSVATTQMRQMFIELSKAGGKTAGIFEEMAGKTFKQFVKEGGNTQDALIMLDKYAGKSGVGINDLFGSVEAGNAALALTGKGTQKFTEALNEMANSAGATDAAYETMDKGIGRVIDSMKANFAVLKLDVGENLAPTFEMAANFISDNMDTIERVITDVALISVEKFGKIIDVLSEITDVYFPGLTSSTDDMATGFTDLYDGGLSKVIGGLEWIRDNSELIKGVIITLTGAWLIHKGILVGVAVAQSAQIIASGISRLSSMAETAAIVALYVAQYAQAGALALVTGAQWLWNAALSANPIALVVLLIAGLVLGLVALYKKSETARAIMDGLWEGMKSGAKSAANFVIDRINDIIGGFNNAKDLLNKLGFNFKRTEVVARISDEVHDPSNGLIPMYARGTNFHPGGLARINEEGGEIVDLPRGSRVIPAEETNKILSDSRSSQTIVKEEKIVKIDSLIGSVTIEKDSDFESVWSKLGNRLKDEFLTGGEEVFDV